LAAKLDGLLGLGLRDSSQRVALMERSVVRASALMPGQPAILISRNQEARNCLHLSGGATTTTRLISPRC